MKRALSRLLIADFRQLLQQLKKRNNRPIHDHFHALVNILNNFLLFSSPIIIAAGQKVVKYLKSFIFWDTKQTFLVNLNPFLVTDYCVKQRIETVSQNDLWKTARTKKALDRHFKRLFILEENNYSIFTTFYYFLILFWYFFERKRLQC